jgi:hypothetical protein
MLIRKKNRMDGFFRKKISNFNQRNVYEDTVF